MVAAAIGVTGALSAGSSLFGASQQAGAAASASAAQVAAQKQAIATQKQYFGIGQGELQPFQTEGVQAGGQLGSLLGLTGGGAQAQNTLQNLPGYQFSLAQGQQAQANSITSRGLGLSGAQLRGASDYAQGSASQNYNNYASQLFSLMGLGEQAGGGIANLAGSVGHDIASTQVGIGNAQAAGAIGQANALSSGANGAAGALGGAANSYAGFGLYQNLAAQQSGQGGAYGSAYGNALGTDTSVNGWG